MKDGLLFVTSMLYFFLIGVVLMMGAVNDFWLLMSFLFVAANLGTFIRLLVEARDVQQIDILC